MKTSSHIGISNFILFALHFPNHPQSCNKYLHFQPIVMDDIHEGIELISVFIAHQESRAFLLIRDSWGCFWKGILSPIQ